MHRVLFMECVHVCMYLYACTCIVEDSKNYYFLIYRGRVRFFQICFLNPLGTIPSSGIDLFMPYISISSDSIVATTHY